MHIIVSVIINAFERVAVHAFECINKFVRFPPIGQSGVWRSLVVGVKPWPWQRALAPGRSLSLHLGCSNARMSFSFFIARSPSSLPVSFFLFLFKFLFLLPLLSFSRTTMSQLLLKGSDFSSDTPFHFRLPHGAHAFGPSYSGFRPTDISLQYFSDHHK